MNARSRSRMPTAVTFGGGFLPLRGLFQATFSQAPAQAGRARHAASSSAPPWVRENAGMRFNAYLPRGEAMIARDRSRKVQRADRIAEA